MDRTPQPQHDATILPLPLQPVHIGADHWRAGLPTLTGARVTLRELRITDAPALLAAMSTGAVAQFLSPPPASVQGFERFIEWSHRQRAAGQYISFGVTLRGADEVIGLFQIRSFEPDFGNTEWGFALAEEFWGRGLFLDGAPLAIDFAFDVLGARRLEARAVVKNHRGNGALRRLGAVQEGILRRSFLRYGEVFDQFLWTIISDEWRDSQKGWFSGTIH